MISKIKSTINRYPNLFSLLLFVLLSFLLVLPYLHGPAYQHMPGWDGRFHISRVAESYLNLKAGHITQINPSIMTKTFGSFGYPQNIFYPIFVMLPEAFLQLIIGNAYGAYLAFVGLIFFLTFASMYVCTLKLSSNHYTALLSSILYGLGHFTLTINLFYRSFGGSFAFIFIPIAFYGISQIAIADYRKWWILSLGVTGLIFSDLPDASVSLLLLLLSFLVIFTASESIQTKVKRFLRLVYAGILTIGLTAFFLFPLIQNLLFVKSIAVTKLMLSKTAYPLINLFITDKLASYSLGISGLILVVCIAIYWQKFKAPYKYFSVMLIISILMASTVFPWTPLDKYLSFIQFVGRFLYFATFLAALLGASAITELVHGMQNKKIVISLFCVIGILAGTSLNFNIKHSQVNDSVYETNWRDFQKSTLNNNVYDYLPSKSVGLKDKLLKHDINVMNPKKQIKQLKWSTGYNVIHYQIKAQYAYEKLILPNIYYPGFATYVNGTKVDGGYTKQNLIMTSIKKGINQIDVRYIKTPVQLFSIWLSVLSWIGLLIFNLLSLKRKK
ncbi:YfhO family protein [Weissella paramesenteroides]|uniref:YfhO family protein n=1 Tax=Weissella paramesenteroides TaxID=1249 RepID=UPI001238983D|nr:YfhO family protein [Weissella paramesenteroides]KAA8442456.1 YfhO family protein [Weissella paramesenteroides]KAA8442803.1 YfhO family protein [Weissella paramesenteroides]KAA8444522.1 YfhO family protein [Weissella paramesenteroides]KAA8448189.1 YfhO family protein [Weissella paramesenteroides]KAA8451999.1 YfhO family protein [Weissella paramesenteroides]